MVGQASAALVEVSLAEALKHVVDLLLLAEGYHETGQVHVRAVHADVCRRVRFQSHRRRNLGNLGGLKAIAGVISSTVDITGIDIADVDIVDLATVD